MSLSVNDGNIRDRSRSRSRSRDRRLPEEIVISPTRETSFVLPQDDPEGRFRPSRHGDLSPGGSNLPYSMASPRSPIMSPRSPIMSPTSPVSPAAYTYNAGLPVYAPPSPGLPPNPYRSSREDRESAGGADKFSFLPQKYSQKLSSLTSGSGRHEDDLAYGKPPPEVVKTKNTADLAYGKGPSASAGPASPATYGSYISGGRPVSPADGERRSGRSRGDSFLDPRMSGPTVLTVDGPGSRDRSRSRDGRKRADTLQVDSSSSHRERSRSRDGRRDKSPSRNSLQVDSARRDRSRSRDGRRDTSPQPRMTNLLVDTGKGAGLTLVASPLLESYRGTYQDCSPMPSPLLLASQPSDSHHRIVEPLSPIGSDSEGKRERRARFHDAEDITTRLATALKGSRAPDTGPLIDILPSLTHEQVLELRSEYKRIVKTGSERKGVNISKHIKARLKDEEPLLMKLCYTVALGRWESEAYWANSWYHGDKNRRELLIESLMGRTNAEIAAIKDAFTDKKYDDSLTKCMKTELKEDKFKKAVLMVLDMRRMDEYDQYGRRIPVDLRLVDQDVEDLRRAVTAEKGGESAMISIVVQRSESHLREILKEYERQYRVNFAREALRKSGNLVGELLAHILNGVINRPVRDALLLHHAMTASRKDPLRRELLISRLVRFHWDPHHMQAIKRAYLERYGRDLQDAVRESTNGQWGMFCRELCIARMPDDVKRFERVDVRH